MYTADRAARLERELNAEKQARIRVQQEAAGLKSANKKLKAMVLLARAEVAKAKAESAQDDAA
jgi:hypothetical protein